MLDEFGLTPEQRKQYLAEGREQLKINARRHPDYSIIRIDSDDEDLVLRFIILKKKLQAKREELRQRAIARNNGLDTSCNISKTVLDSPREMGGGFMAKVRRFLGLR